VFADGLKHLESGREGKAACVTQDPSLSCLPDHLWASDSISQPTANPNPSLNSLSAFTYKMGIKNTYLADSSLSASN
jgi:hypothetical protein